MEIQNQSGQVWAHVGSMANIFVLYSNQQLGIFVELIASYLDVLGSSERIRQKLQIACHLKQIGPMERKKN